MIETMRAAGGAGLAANQVGEPLRIAVVEVEPQPALPVQAADPADRDGQPGDRAGRRRDGRRSTRAASRCPTCAATLERLVTVRVRYLDRDGDRARRGRARADRRDVPARGRPPRRRPVPRPRRGPAHASRPGSSSSATTATAFVRAHRASSSSGSAREPRSGASWRGSAASGRAPAC